MIQSGNHSLKITLENLFDRVFGISAKRYLNYMIIAQMSYEIDEKVFSINHKIYN